MGLALAPSALVATWRQGPVVSLQLQLMEGDLKDRRTLAGHGPAPQPAAITAIVDADDLIQRPVLAVSRQLDAVALVKVGGGAGHGGEARGDPAND